MDKKLYHISLSTYKIGQVLDARKFEQTRYYGRQTKNGLVWIDKFLDKHKPDNAPSRKNTFFAFSRPGMCAHFFDRSKLHDAQLYEVEMIAPVGCPMAMIAVIQKHGHDPDQALADEYWKPKSEWNILEYLSPNMKIVRLVHALDEADVQMAASAYNKDIEDGLVAFPIAQ